ncbi:Cutinase [Ascochyta rabiei]|uniref:Cutinase n=1 Tax=Didymella rabiei TaxID=5454 RepID=A0A162ZA90_DIDRA|nr:Cutinase [Ascochyta rabiei]KZM20493.1 cutinase [Ascochyta rabiei]UPX14066.1 Cutinase [Ascochyta rabiei]
MKYTTASVIALAGAANALPHPILSFPSFSMPSFSLPTGFGGGSSTGGSGLGAGLGGLGSGGSSTGGSGLGAGLGGLGGSGSPFSLPSFSMPTGLGGQGFGLGNLGGGSNIQVTATPTASGATPTKTSSAGGNTGGGAANNGASCGGTGGGSSENGVKGGNCCTDMTVIFARGTGELGNMGTISGPPMVKAIRSKLGADRVTVQGVDYAASAAGNANLGADGGKVMAQYVQQALKQCPSTKVIVSGYSQGGMVVHNAFSNGISASNVAGAVMFGDPLKRQAIPGLSTDKVKQFCGTADQICGGGGDGGATGSHLSYGSVADSAATFAIQAAGLA